MELVKYRVNIYFSNGKSLGFIDIDLDSDKPEDTTSIELRKLINVYNERYQEVVQVHSGKALYYIDIYQISLIEVIKRH